jgi:hypothetical protein
VSAVQIRPPLPFYDVVLFGRYGSHLAKGVQARNESPIGELWGLGARAGKGDRSCPSDIE